MQLLKYKFCIGASVNSGLLTREKRVVFWDTSRQFIDHEATAQAIETAGFRAENDGHQVDNQVTLTEQGIHSGIAHVLNANPQTRGIVPEAIKMRRVEKRISDYVTDKVHKQHESHDWLDRQRDRLHNLGSNIRHLHRLVFLREDAHDRHVAHQIHHDFGHGHNAGDYIDHFLGTNRRLYATVFNLSQADRHTVATILGVVRPAPTNISNAEIFALMRSASSTQLGALLDQRSMTGNRAYLFKGNEAFDDYRELKNILEDEYDTIASNPEKYSAQELRRWLDILRVADPNLHSLITLKLLKPDALHNLEKNDDAKALLSELRDSLEMESTRDLQFQNMVLGGSALRPGGQAYPAVPPQPATANSAPIPGQPLTPVAPLPFLGNIVTERLTAILSAQKDAPIGSGTEINATGLPTPGELNLARGGLVDAAKELGSAYGEAQFLARQIFLQNQRIATAQQNLGGARLQETGLAAMQNKLQALESKQQDMFTQIRKIEKEYVTKMGVIVQLLKKVTGGQDIDRNRFPTLYSMYTELFSNNGQQVVYTIDDAKIFDPTNGVTADFYDKVAKLITDDRLARVDLELKKELVQTPKEQMSAKVLLKRYHVERLKATMLDQNQREHAAILATNLQIGKVKDIEANKSANNLDAGTLVHGNNSRRQRMRQWHQRLSALTFNGDYFSAQQAIRHIAGLSQFEAHKDFWESLTPNTTEDHIKHHLEHAHIDRKSIAMFRVCLQEVMKGFEIDGKMVRLRETDAGLLHLTKRLRNIELGIISNLAHDKITAGALDSEILDAESEAEKALEVELDALRNGHADWKRSFNRKATVRMYLNKMVTANKHCDEHNLDGEARLQYMREQGLSDTVRRVLNRHMKTKEGVDRGLNSVGFVKDKVLFAATGYVARKAKERLDKRKERKKVAREEKVKKLEAKKAAKKENREKKKADKAAEKAKKLAARGGKGVISHTLSTLFNLVVDVPAAQKKIDKRKAKEAADAAKKAAKKGGGGGGHGSGH